MDNMSEGLEADRCYADDVLVWGGTRSETITKKLTKVLQRVRENGQRLNGVKYQFGVQEITFLSDKMSARGIEPDEIKKKVILGTPRPTDKTGIP